MFPLLPPQPYCSWYGPGDPKLCFIERKTHRDSWKGEKSVKERFTLPEHKVGGGGGVVAEWLVMWVGRSSSLSADTGALPYLTQNRNKPQEMQMGPCRGGEYLLDAIRRLILLHPPAHPASP